MSIILCALSRVVANTCLMFNATNSTQDNTILMMVLEAVM